MKLVIVRSDGGVSVAHPAPENIEDFIARWQTSSAARAVAHYLCEDAHLPQEREFRDAWTDDGGKVGVSLPRAKDVTKVRLRREREPLLAAQDVAFMRALETGQDTSAIVVEKQRLRDLPALADAAGDLAALKALRA